MCHISDFQHLKLDAEHRTILEKELDIWHEWYLPCAQGEDIQIDIGAGNGETAQFYLNHGSRRIVSFEPNSKLLHENFDGDPRVTIFDGFVGNVKSDGEGCERNMSLEIHFPFKLKFVKQSNLADAYTSTWKLVALNRQEKLQRLLNLRIWRIQTAHFVRKSINGLRFSK